MKKCTLTEYCTLYDRPELLREWDKEKNGGQTPDTVYPYSKKGAFWCCEKGHGWQASINSRVSGRTGCPYCAGRAVLPGENDLATIYPEIAAEWHPTKNNELLPNMVRPGAHRRVWWRCEHGHEWITAVKARVAGNGCPYCSGHIAIPGETDLATLYPELALEWHPTLNGTLTPNEVRPGTSKKVWWRCEHGHEWQAVIGSRVSGNGCPVCAGKKVVAGINDLATHYPDLAKEWHPTKNGDFKPDMVSAMSNRTAWWQDALGHEWQTTVAARTRGDQCPICTNKKLLPGFNDLQTRFPEIAKEWDSVKNGITPDKVLRTNRKAWWRCPNGHEYHSSISARVFNGIGCPVCANRTIIAGINDLATHYPDLAKEWHPTKNGELKPTMVSVASNKKVWWQDKYGHEWEALVSARSSKGTGCPYCAGRAVLVGFNDLASQKPEIAAQWHPTLNGKKTPEMFTSGSGQNAWWLCGFGHAWQAPISRRCCQRSDCPVCNGKVSKKKLQKYARMMDEILAEQKNEQWDFVDE